MTTYTLHDDCRAATEYAKFRQDGAPQTIHASDKSARVIGYALEDGSFRSAMERKLP